MRFFILNFSFNFQAINSVDRVESGGFEQDTMNLLFKGKFNEIQRTR